MIDSQIQSLNNILLLDTPFWVLASPEQQDSGPWREVTPEPYEAPLSDSGSAWIQYSVAILKILSA